MWHKDTMHPKHGNNYAFINDKIIFGYIDWHIVEIDSKENVFFYYVRDRIFVLFENHYFYM